MDFKLHKNKIFFFDSIVSHSQGNIKIRYNQKKKNIPENRGPRFAGIKPGQFFSYKHPLRILLSLIREFHTYKKHVP